MKTTQTDHPHIIRVEGILGGEPVVKGTRTPVRAIVENWRMGVPPEQIPQRLPHLNMAQVFDALGYFEDHEQEILSYVELNRIPAGHLQPVEQQI